MSNLDAVVITYNCGRELVNPGVFSNHVYGALNNASPVFLVLALEEIAPIAYSFLGGVFLKSYFDSLQSTVDLIAGKWGGPRYTSVKSYHVGMTAIMVFIRDDQRSKLVAVETAHVGVGWYEMGNKGAVAVNVKLRDTDNAASPREVEATFVAAHLAPMEWQLQRRNEDWRRITESLVFEATTAAADVGDKASVAEEQPLLSRDPDQVDSEAHSASARGIYSTGRHVIVAGDLNYRTSDRAPRPASRAMFPRISVDEDSPSHYRNLLSCDQLSQEIRHSRALQGFEEAPITFPPTYKYSASARRAMAALETDDLRPGSRRDEVVGTGDEDDEFAGSPALDLPWSTHRWPSWCDRILFLTCDVAGVKPLKYTSLPLMSTSDHQPVLLHLEIPWSSPSSDLRRKPPYEIDESWQQRRAVARRLEIATGIAAYITTTWEGRAGVLACLLAYFGSVMIGQRLL